MHTREALVFDVYGTLVDPRGRMHLRSYFASDEAEHVSELWRQKQLEYTFRLTAMEKYEDFEHLTRKALEYTLAALGEELDSHSIDALMSRYQDDLEPFADVHPGLDALREAGYELYAFSNGTPSMLASLLDRKGLASYFLERVSVDEVRTYKPAPRVYRHVAERVSRPIGNVRLISSNPFDVVGAMNAGMQTAWIDRVGGVFDGLGEEPEVAVRSLTHLANYLNSRQ